MKCNLYWLALIGLVACQPLPSVPVELSAYPPTIISEAGPEVYHYWDLPQDPAWWQTADEVPPSVALFQDSLRQVLGTALFERVLDSQALQRPPGPEDPPFDSLDNADRVHLGGLGKVQPICQWEAQVLGYQLARFPLLGHPTEFHAFVVEDPAQSRFRIYFTASDTPFPPRQGKLVEHFSPLLAEGWTLRCHLHNHYNEPEGNYLGVTAPSKADAHFYKGFHQSLGLQEARVTNGFHTAVLPAETFERFESH